MAANIAFPTSVVVTYWFVSISMLYLNKVLMTNGNLFIPAPIFITWYQSLATTGICWVVGLIGRRAKDEEAARYQSLAQADDANLGGGGERNASFFAQFPLAQYRLSMGKKILPLSLVHVCMITFNNLCLKHVHVSFYNVARSLTIVFSALFSYVFLGVSSSRNTIICLMLVIIGFIIGARGEVDLNTFGTISGIISSMFVALNSIYIKEVLPMVDDNHWRLTFYNNVNASIILLPFALYFELETIQLHGARLFSGLFWFGMSLATVFGFSIGIVTVMQIKATSPLAHNISGTAKAFFQSVLAFWIWGNQATGMYVFGLLAVLGGSLLYTIVKMYESNALKIQLPAPSSASNMEEGKSLTETEMPRR